MGAAVGRQRLNNYTEMETPVPPKGSTRIFEWGAKLPLRFTPRTGSESSYQLDPGSLPNRKELPAEALLMVKHTLDTGNYRRRVAPFTPLVETSPQVAPLDGALGEVATGTLRPPLR